MRGMRALLVFLLVAVMLLCTACGGEDGVSSERKESASVTESTDTPLRTDEDSPEQDESPVDDGTQDDEVSGDDDAASDETDVSGTGETTEQGEGGSSTTRPSRGSSKTGKTDKTDAPDDIKTSDGKTDKTTNKTSANKTSKTSKTTTKKYLPTIGDAPEGWDNLEDDTTTKTTVSTKKTTMSTKKTTTTTKKTTTTTKRTRPSGPEEPVAINTALLYDEHHSVYDKKAETRRQAILDLPDTVKANGGKTYYIAPNGKDTNAGTKAAPWKTHKHINDGTVKSGDAVLFQRGGVYRDVSIQLPDGVSLGAYGTGAKPQLYGGDRNYGYEDEWQKDSKANVWKAKLPTATTGTPMEDIGNIVFDYGVKTGSEGKVFKKGDLSKDYDFYYDYANDTVYLYLSKGNPGAVHHSIEMCPNEHIVRAQNVSNSVIENLCIKYTAAHGIVYSVPGRTSEANNVIRGCEIGYIGGGMLWWEQRMGKDQNGDGDMTDMVRFGNGIEINVNETGTMDGFVVEDNWIYHCFDAGYTNQGNGWHKNLKIRDNLIEYCQYNIEIWTHKTVGKGGLVDCTYESNILRFAGFSFGSFNRVGSSTVVCANFSCYDYVTPSENTVIKNNVFDCSYRYLVSIVYPNDTAKRGPTIKNNTWIQQKYTRGKDFWEPLGTTASVGQTKSSSGARIIHESSTEAIMKQSVKVFDSAPTEIVWDN